MSTYFCLSIHISSHAWIKGRNIFITLKNILERAFWIFVDMVLASAMQNINCSSFSNGDNPGQFIQTVMKNTPVVSCSWTLKL